jgi:hypothetical protein
MIGMRPSSFEEDLSLIDWIKLGTVMDMAITKRISITCKGPTSFGYFQKNQKVIMIGMRPSSFQK